MAENEEKAITRRECENCPLKVEVMNLKAWVRSIDMKFWAVLVIVLGNILATVMK